MAEDSSVADRNCLEYTVDVPVASPKALAWPSIEWPRKCDEYQSEESTAAASVACSSSEGSVERCTGRHTIQWDQIWLGNRIQSYQRYAGCADDIRLLSHFLKLANIPDINGASVKLMLRVLDFLRNCDYSFEDMCSMLAHASAYYLDVLAVCGDRMESSEEGNVLAILIFIAHSWVQDENCKLAVWHRHLFKKYCSMTTLNEAVLHLLKIRPVLRLEDDDLDRRFTYLLSAARWKLHTVSATSDVAARQRHSQSLPDHVQLGPNRGAVLKETRRDTEQSACWACTGIRFDR